MRYISNSLPPIIFFIVFLLGWELLGHLLSIPEYLLPVPTKIFAAIRGNFTSIISDTAVTMFEAAVGFVIANAFGILVAVAFVHSRIIERGLYPYAVAFKAIPLVAFAPLLVLWFGSGPMSKIVMAATISFFPIIVNATIGLKSIDSEAIDLMNSLSASKIQILFKLRLPASLPYIFSALKISSTLSVIGAIVAEMSGATKGIGHAIMLALYNYETPAMFAGIFASSFAGILFFSLITIIEKKVITWHDSIQNY